MFKNNLIIGEWLWEASIKDDTEKHEPVVKIANRENQLRTSVEPNVDNYYNELISFSKWFATKIVRDKTGFI